MGNKSFSAWDDLKFTVGGFFLLLLPLILVGLLFLAFL